MPDVVCEQISCMRRGYICREHQRLFILPAPKGKNSVQRQIKFNKPNCTTDKQRELNDLLRQAVCCKYGKQRDMQAVFGNLMLLNPITDSKVMK